MDPVVAWIAQDIARKPPGGWRRSAVAVGIIGIAVALAFGLRRDFDGVFTWDYLLPAAAMLLPVTAAVWWILAAGASTGRRLAVILGAFALVLLLTLPHPGASPGFAYGDVATFWAETGTCFWKGLLTGVVAALALGTATALWLPVPSRRLQLASGVVASMAGVLMLNLHCMSPHYGHILLGHWAPAVPLVLATVAVQRWWVQRVLRRILPQAQTSLHDLSGLT